MKNFLIVLSTLFLLPVMGYSQTVSVDTLFANNGSEVQIPVNVTDLSGLNFRSAEFMLMYDDSFIEIDSVTVGDVSGFNPSFEVNTSVDGQVRFSLITDVESGITLSGAGALAVIHARVVGYGESVLDLSDVFLGTTMPDVSDGLLSTSVPVYLEGPEFLNNDSTGTYTVSVGELDGRAIRAFEVFISFDGTGLDISDTSVEFGELLDGLPDDALAVNVVESTNQLRVAYGDTTALSSSGTLFTFDATAVATTPGLYRMEFVNVIFSDASEPFRNTAFLVDPFLDISIDDFVFLQYEPVTLSNTLNGVSIIDVVLSDVTDFDIRSFEIDLLYDESGLLIDSVLFTDDLSSLNEGEFNLNNTDIIRTAGISGGTEAYQGEGSIIRLFVRNVSQGTFVMDFNSVLFNTGTPVGVGEALVIVVDNEAPSATTITFPEDDATVLVEGLPNAEFIPAWTESTDPDFDELTYEWQLAADDEFETVLLNIPSLTDNSVILTLGAVGDLLSANGHAVGDTITVFHRANTNDGSVLVNGNAASVNLVLGVVNTPPTPTDITTPADGAAITIQGDPSAPFVPRWTSSTDEDGDDLTYIWQIGVSEDFAEGTVVLSVPDLAETELPLTVQAVADLLDANNIEVGVPTQFFHRANTSDGKTIVEGNGSSVTLTRGTLTNIDSELPISFGLDQNYPNPFNPVTSINYQVAESRMVSVRVYDMLGREVATLVNDVQQAGSYSIAFDASNLSSGIYIYRMVSGDFVQTRKMTIMK